jgi:hypothetical protein
MYLVNYKSNEAEAIKQWHSFKHKAAAQKPFHLMWLNLSEVENALNAWMKTNGTGLC